MILVTGANGFVGRAVVSRLLLDHAAAGLIAATRGHVPLSGSAAKTMAVGDIDGDTNWQQALQGVQSLVHCAARVHVMNERSANPLAAFRKVNVEGTVNLARQAAASGVKRFVFVSSVKVNGESTSIGHPFSVDDQPAPQDPYAISKHEAEQSLRQIATATGMEVVIVRPPLVYGPGVKANFSSMLQWVARGIPLPLGAVTFNRRSFVAMDNLVDFIALCLNHPAAANQTFFVSDGEDLSTAELIHRMGQALGTPVRMMSVSPVLLQLGAAAVNRRSVYARLCGSLQVDISGACNLLGWRPPLSVNAGLQRAVKGLK